MDHQVVEATAQLTNDKVQFTGSAGTNPPIIFDYYPPAGDGQGYTGLEGFLTSLAACSATSVLAVLRKMRKNVAALRVNAKGIRRDQHPTCFQKISLEFVIDSPDVAAADLQRAIQISEESLCPVWAMIKNNVEVVTAYQIKP